MCRLYSGGPLRFEQSVACECGGVVDVGADAAAAAAVGVHVAFTEDGGFAAAFAAGERGVVHLVADTADHGFCAIALTLIAHVVW
jgi:hypothetical protein